MELGIYVSNNSLVFHIASNSFHNVIMYVNKKETSCTITRRSNNVVTLS